jgi:hypothetical protein
VYFLQPTIKFTVDQKTRKNQHNDYASVQGGGDLEQMKVFKSMNETLAHTAKQPMKKFFLGYFLNQMKRKIRVQLWRGPCVIPG